MIRDKLFYKDLDYAMIHLGNTNITHPRSINEIFDEDKIKNLSEFEKEIILEQLRFEGFCGRDFPESFDNKSHSYRENKSDPQYYITYEGWRLLNKQLIKTARPYTVHHTTRKIKNAIYEVIKMTPILIAIYAIWISVKSFDISERNFQIENNAY